MKKESRQQRTDVRTLRQKLRSAAMMLLIAAILMTSSSYAWFILATAPEATGITTNIGANGSLEIALLNTETYQDTSRITAKLGDSIEVQSRTAANVTWGNLVDLSDPSYGLSNINLLPARLNFAASNSKVSAGLLAIPSYGYDGRIKKLNKDTVTTTFQSGKFNYDSLKQQYGVRAVGVAADQTSAAATLSYAKTAITAFAGSARSEASAAFST